MRSYYQGEPQREYVRHGSRVVNGGQHVSHVGEGNNATIRRVSNVESRVVSGVNNNTNPFNR